MCSVMYPPFFLSCLNDSESIISHWIVTQVNTFSISWRSSLLSNEIQSIRMCMLIFKDLLFSRIDTIEVQQWSMYSSLIAKKIGIVVFMLVWLKRIICQRQRYQFFRYISVYKDYFYRYMTFGIKKGYVRYIFSDNIWIWSKVDIPCKQI